MTPKFGQGKGYEVFSSKNKDDITDPNMIDRFAMKSSNRIKRKLGRSCILSTLVFNSN